MCVYVYIDKKPSMLMLLIVEYTDTTQGILCYICKTEYDDTTYDRQMVLYR